jgi:hypothetical protein
MKSKRMKMTNRFLERRKFFISEEKARGNRSGERERERERERRKGEERESERGESN